MVKITDLPGGAILLAVVMRIYLCFDGIYGNPWLFIDQWCLLIQVRAVDLQDACGMTCVIAGACARDVLFPCVWPAFRPTEEELIGINVTIPGLP